MGLGKILYDKCGLSRSRVGLEEAIASIRTLRDRFYRELCVPGGPDMNSELEKAGRVADYLPARCSRWWWGDRSEHRFPPGQKRSQGRRESLEWFAPLGSAGCFVGRPSPRTFGVSLHLSP
jgi:hypothetical protein